MMADHAEQSERAAAIMEASFGPTLAGDPLMTVTEKVPTYTENLAVLVQRHPRLAQRLLDAEESRRSQLAKLIDGARLSGVDELLRHLDAVSEAFRADPALRDLAPLIQRIAAEFETAVEATIAGYLAVVTDAMRDVMETEMLLLDFAVEPARIVEWLAATSQERFRKFKPVVLRDRLRAAGIGRYRNLVTDPDYKGHSEALHVSPNQHPLFLKGMQHERDLLVPDGGFWELFEHARRVLYAIDALRDRVASSPWPEIRRGTDLLVFLDGWARTQQMQLIYMSLLRAPDELRERLGREPDEREILRYVSDQLKAQAVDPRLPFSGAGRIRRFLWRVFGQ
jgi:hypothetical protein